jgi:hypothetical protein
VDPSAVVELVEAGNLIDNLFFANPLK